jgi:hypothetical protein
MRIFDDFGNICGMPRIVGLLILCLALTACTSGGGDSTDSALPTGSGPVSSATPSPTPTVTRTGPLTTGPGVKPGEKPPQLSSLAIRVDNAGVIAFGAYFVSALDWSLATTDPYLLEQISDPECGPCSTYIKGLEQVQSAGGAVVGGRATFLSSAISSGNLVAADAVVEVTFSQSAEVVTEPGAAPRTFPAPPQPAVNKLYLKRRVDSWSILEIGIPS